MGLLNEKKYFVVKMTALLFKIDEKAISFVNFGMSIRICI